MRCIEWMASLRSRIVGGRELARVCEGFCLLDRARLVRAIHRRAATNEPLGGLTGDDVSKRTDSASVPADFLRSQTSFLSVVAQHLEGEVLPGGLPRAISLRL